MGRLIWQLAPTLLVFGYSRLLQFIRKVERDSASELGRISGGIL